MAADLTIPCTGDLYEHYKKWAYIGFYVYMLFLPLTTTIVLYNRQNLIASPEVIEKLRRIYNVRELRYLRLSNYYRLILPFEGLYTRYKSGYWWYDIFSLFVNILLTSVIRTMFANDSDNVLVSIFVIIIYYIIEGRVRPYRNKFEFIISYYSIFQVLVLYLSMYVRMLAMLGPDEIQYEYLDIFLVSSQVLIIILDIYCLVIYFKERHIGEANNINNNNNNDVVRKAYINMNINCNSFVVRHSLLLSILKNNTCWGIIY